MLRSVRNIPVKRKVLQGAKLQSCFYASSASARGRGKNALITVIAVAGVGAGATIAYGKYDPKFRKFIEESVPYSDVVFKSIPDWNETAVSSEQSSPVISDPKIKEAALESSLLKKKQERQKKEEKPVQPLTAKREDPVKQQEDKSKADSPVITESVKVGDKATKPSVSDSKKQLIDEHAAIESSVKNLIDKLERSVKDAVSAEEAAVAAIKCHTSILYQALDTPEGLVTENMWKQADIASSKEASALNSANEKVSDAKAIMDKLKEEIKHAYENYGSFKSPVLFAGEAALNKTEQLLKDTAAKVAAAQVNSRSASEYKELVNKARDQFRNELQIVLPKYVHKGKDEGMTEDELNLLIAHAHRRIENLQKDLAKQQVTEKQRIEEAKQVQKIEDEQTIRSRIDIELARHQKKLEAGFQKQLDVIRDEFEADMRQQLRRQAGAHADHLQEALHVQKQEMARKHSVQLDETLLQQKGVFISQISESLARVKGMENYLRTRAELDIAARKAQALWLACQAMKNTIHSGFADSPKPVGKELAVVRAAAGEDSSFVTSILAGIPLEAVQRGVYTDEYLKHRFNKVKKMCCRVAMIDSNNNSIYRYVLSYIQSFFIIHKEQIPKEELESNVAVDPSEWDTFDILNRVSYCLQRNDFEQALRYANQLRGEPRNVAKDWISEVRLLLETSQAVDCLITFAASIGVQSYH